MHTIVQNIQYAAGAQFVLLSTLSLSPLTTREKIVGKGG